MTGLVRPRWLFLAAAVVVLVGSVLLSRTHHAVVHYSGEVFTVPAEPTQTPCPFPSNVAVLCNGEPEHVETAPPTTTLQTSYRPVWIAGGLAAALVLAGLGLALDPISRPRARNPRDA